MEQMLPSVIQGPSHNRTCPRLLNPSYLDTSGNLLEYILFIIALEHVVERKTDNNRICIYLMEKYASGKPRD